MEPQHQRRAQALTILLLTIPLGLAVRYLPLHLPYFLWKYLGSALWAIALYWFPAALLPKLRPLPLFIVSSTIATLVELSRLIPIPPVDAFRLTLAGKLLLGSHFSFKNIAAYLFAIAIAALADHYLASPPNPNPVP